MMSIFFHLALTFALLWYQRKQSFRPSLWQLSGLWYVVSILLALIETSTITGSWLSGMFLQALAVTIFYVPAVFVTLRLARRGRMMIWKSFAIFFCLALVSTILAAMALAYVPFIQQLSY